MEILNIHYTDKRLTHLLALIDIFMSHNNLRHIFSKEFILFDVNEAWADIDFFDFRLIFAGPDFIAYIELLHNFIHDPARSGKLALDGTRYATAAEVCLAYLCDHSGDPQKMPRRWDRRDNKIRRNTPWLWRRIIGQHGVLEKSRTWWKKKCDHFYHSESTKWALWKKDLSNPVIAQWVWSKKYSLGLLYISHFLPRSDKSEELVQFCRRRTFTPRSQEFPYRVKRLRRTMMEYLERVEGKEAKI
jgi:hypothetical protein